MTAMFLAAPKAKRLGGRYNFQGFCLVQSVLSDGVTAYEVVVGRLISGGPFDRRSLLSCVEGADEVGPDERNQRPVFCSGGKTLQRLALHGRQVWLLRRH
jgi:hypothetical protein